MGNVVILIRLIGFSTLIFKVNGLFNLLLTMGGFALMMGLTVLVSAGNLDAHLFVFPLLFVLTVPVLILFIFVSESFLSLIWRSILIWWFIFIVFVVCFNLYDFQLCCLLTFFFIIFLLEFLLLLLANHPNRIILIQDLLGLNFFGSLFLLADIGWWCYLNWTLVDLMSSLKPRIMYLRMVYQWFWFWLMSLIFLFLLVLSWTFIFFFRISSLSLCFFIAVFFVVRL